MPENPEDLEIAIAGVNPDSTLDLPENVGSPSERTFLDKLSYIFGQRGRLVAGFATAFGLMALHATIASAKNGPGVFARKDLKKAKATYVEGTRLYETGKYRGAMSVFTQLYAETKKPALLFNIAQCYVKLAAETKDLNLYKEAIENFRLYIEKIGENSSEASGARGEIAEVEAAMAALEKELKALSVAEPAKAAPPRPAPATLPVPPPVAPDSPAARLAAPKVPQPAGPPPPPASQPKTPVSPPTSGQAPAQTQTFPPPLSSSFPPPQRRRTLLGLEFRGGSGIVWDPEEKAPVTRRVDSAGFALTFHRTGSRHTQTLGAEWRGDLDRTVTTQGTVDRVFRPLPVPENCVVVRVGDQIHFLSQEARLQLYAILGLAGGYCFRESVTTEDGRYPNTNAGALSADAGLGVTYRVMNYGGYRLGVGAELAAQADGRFYEIGGKRITDFGFGARAVAIADLRFR